MDNMNVKQLRNLHYQSDSDCSSDGEASDQKKHILKKFAPSLYSYNELKSNLVLIEPGNKSSEVSAKSDFEIYEIISKELEDISKKLSCEICDIKDIPPANSKTHFNGKRHKQNAEIYTKERFEWFKEHNNNSQVLGVYNVTSSSQVLLSDSEIYEIISKELEDISKKLSCKICNIKYLPEADQKPHFNGWRHRNNAEIYTIEQFEWLKEHNNNTQVLSDNNVTSSNKVLLSDSKIHKVNAKKTEKTSKKISCEICGIEDIRPASCNDHFNGENHKKKTKIYTEELFELSKQHKSTTQVLSDNNVSSSNQVLLSASNDITSAGPSKEGSNNRNTNDSLTIESMNHNMHEDKDDVNKTYAKVLKATPVSSVVQNIVKSESSFKNDVKENCGDNITLTLNDCENFKDLDGSKIKENKLPKRRKGKRGGKEKLKENTSVSNTLKDVTIGIDTNADYSLQNDDTTKVYNEDEQNNLNEGEEIKEKSEIGIEFGHKVASTVDSCKNSEELDNSNIKENKLPERTTKIKPNEDTNSVSKTLKYVAISNNTNADYGLENYDTKKVYNEDEQNNLRGREEVPFVNVDRNVPGFIKTYNDDISSNISVVSSFNDSSLNYEIGRFLRNANFAYMNIPSSVVLENLRENNERMEEMIKNYVFQNHNKNNGWLKTSIICLTAVAGYWVIRKMKKT